MAESVERLWQNEAERRGRVRMWLIIAMVVMLSLLIVLWAMLTQPLLSAVTTKPSSVNISADHLKAHVRMLSETLVPRDYRHPENLDRVAEYLRRELASAQGKVAEQVWQVEGRTYRNVVARFGPETNERIVVGAHYDTCQPYPGADDNASGVAGLIELARLLGQTQLPLTVELVAYTLEEPPYFRSTLMGSAVHARALKAQGVAVRAMFSLEMLGYFSDEPGSQSYPNPVLQLCYPSQGNFIAVVGNFDQTGLTRRVKRAMRETGLLPVYSINAPGWLPGIDFSDHLNYWQAGYPAIMITDTSFYRNKNYHTPHDTAEKLDYNRLARVVQAVYAAVLAVVPAE